MRTLHWFRVDLRTHDNSGLYHAALAGGGKGGRGVVGLFVVTPGEWGEHDESPAKIELILRTLGVLKESLARLNIPLLVRTSADFRATPGVVAQVAREVGAEGVYANRQYEVNEVKRDEQLEVCLRAQGGRLHLYHDQAALEPGEVRTGDGGAYTVFTPFKKKWVSTVLERGGIGGPGAACGVTVWPVPGKQAPTGINSDDVPASVAGFVSGVDAGLWPAGEEYALGRLRGFLDQRVRGYKDDRNTPGVEGTSRLSPYLAIGALSARECLRLASQANGGSLDGGQAGCASWISEVLWREFYKHLLWAFPRLSRGRAFKPATERIVWSDNRAHLHAWQQGLTGFPIVDAGCRQLLKTGWMHNRLRMVTAMFLSKDLFIDWREGERHFMRHLVDGDLSQNNGGWQWAASTGTDAAPYFRIFNPALQSAKFDPDGSFIKEFVPELRGVPAEFIHEPQSAPMQVLAKLDYPAPIIDRAESKERVLAAFRGVGDISAG